MLNETKDFSGKHVRLYMGNGEYTMGQVKESRKIGDHWQFTFDGEDWHWADTRFVKEIFRARKDPIGIRIHNWYFRFILRNVRWLHQWHMNRYYKKHYSGKNRVIVESVDQVVGGDGKGGLVYKSQLKD